MNVGVLGGRLQRFDLPELMLCFASTAVFGDSAFPCT